MAAPQKRAVLIVMDSVGIGGADDAALFGDEGANTLGHIVEAAEAGQCDLDDVRSGPLNVPNLTRLGLFNALAEASGVATKSTETSGAWGVGVEYSVGKDTTTGHWEIAGCPVQRTFHYFPDAAPTIPQSFIEAVVEASGIEGVLGNRHASGTQIIDVLGEAHVRTGKPIFYTSADSVIQIAAHEESFGLCKLYDLCKVVRILADDLGVGRVIARPFSGISGCFSRTENRRDFSMPPPAKTVLDHLIDQGRPATGVGKIADIFAGRGLSRSVKTTGVDGALDATISVLDGLPDGGLVFANVVEFDSDFGHRRDVAGYANALEQFDRKLPELTSRLREGDILILTADHGNDPTWKGSDHTRERTPILMSGPGVMPGPLGLRAFSDIAATIANHLDIPGTGTGRSFLPQGPQT